ncbi:precorrin-6y C5,15-methyltransferase (decarboxylating) subunit CbiE [Frigidibacter sp. MR17.14]|uniref:precorrin-6y C5,15-methyltransferase (decarboxylating) subunit CbiE n=1 Tax=Frigidibacter sp. MR17.14 TaxID=3126509 RepID=UPI003012AA34
MAEPWVTIIGLGEDGLSGLPPASRAALDAAEVVFGGARHLDLAGIEPHRARPWPVPFDAEPVLALRGRPVAVLASGDPFWHGAGGTLAALLSPGDWRCLPAPSTVSLAAARLGWRLEECLTLGLHAAPFARLRPLLAPGTRALVTLRDGAAAGEMAQWLTDQGHGPSRLWVMEALGGPRERITATTAETFALAPAAPCLMAIEAAGTGFLPRSPGLPDALFAHDGQITKAPVRALTLSALAPRPCERLWDIGGGSGSVSVEWCLAGGLACTIEAKPARAANIRANADRFGLAHRLSVTEGTAPAALAGLPEPQAVFVGGGFSAPLFATLQVAAPAARLVVNAVTLETEALLATLQAEHGGTLLKVELSEAQPLGRMRGWTAARPVVQWRLG